MRYSAWRHRAGLLTRMERCSILAKVTPRILPGVTAIGQGAWLNADMFGDKVDRGGSINILTSHRPSPLAKGNPSHSNLVQVEKA
ncbi:anaerobic dimethyl sulfoxide reductase chain a [Salmonella enterica subsp. enterica serovar Enteritidis str. 6.0562-1]|nr:anaerobic dimethyl sulfoxide reductase chain a [Salmonella enterica subsp. enterica serovar Enteritidis str. 6.0562-1]